VTIEKIDNIELGVSRLVTQFREATNFINYIKALLREADTLEEISCQLLEDRYLATALGRQLDIIGEIVGQPRILIDSTAFEYFGFTGAIGANSFGTLTNPTIGARFKSIHDPIAGNRTLLDEEYRVFIRARIIKNSTTGTIQEVIDAIKRIQPSFESVTVIGGDLTLTIDFGRPLTANEELFITTTDLIPRAASVEYIYINT